MIEPTNFDADVVGVLQDENDYVYYVMKDHILWVDGIAELCWSISDLCFVSSGEPYPSTFIAMDPIVYQTDFERFFYEWCQVFAGRTVIVEQE